MQLPWVTAACSILWRDYIFGERKYSVRYILWAVDEVHEKAPVLLGLGLAEEDLHSTHKLLRSAPAPRETDTNSAYHLFSAHIQTSSQSQTFQNNTNTHSCFMYENKWDFREHREKGGCLGSRPSILRSKIPAPFGWTLVHTGQL